MAETSGPKAKNAEWSSENRGTGMENMPALDKDPALKSGAREVEPSTAQTQEKLN